MPEIDYLRISLRFQAKKDTYLIQSLKLDRFIQFLVGNLQDF